MMSRSSLAAMIDVRKMLSSDAVGLAESSLSCQSLVGLPFLLSLFSVRNISASWAFFFSEAVSSDTRIGPKHDLSCSCFIFLSAAFFPYSPKVLSPFWRMCCCPKASSIVQSLLNVIVDMAGSHSCDNSLIFDSLRSRVDLWFS
jgi:hypothetical protein